LNQPARAGPAAFTILLVEDDPSVAQIYKAQPRARGIPRVSDGLMALEMARRHLPDIMFLDIRIPKMDGLTVLETLRSDMRSTRIPGGDPVQLE
jgi:CheY-like chemotaxis protein